MKKTWFKNLFRDIKHTFSRFLSILIITAVGVAFYSGVRAASPDMQQYGDNYFKNKNFMDFKLVSTMGITKEDIAELKKQKNVKMAEGGYAFDAVVSGHSLVVNVDSQPNKNGINDIQIVKGRRALNNNEVVVEENLFQKNKLKIGKQIYLDTGNDNKITDILKNNKFTIVGTAKSPMYISAQRQISSIGNGTVKGFVYILPGVFKSEAYTEAYVKLNGVQSKNSLLANEEYNSYAKYEQKLLKSFGAKRADIAYNKFITTAQNAIDEKEQKVNKIKAQVGDIPVVSTYEAEIQKSSQALKEVKKPVWYIFGRSLNLGYETYKEDTNRIDNIGKVFPLIFFLVAALVSLTTMTRLVQQNRTETGIFKALGYSKAAISAHYLIYALLASIGGSIIGVCVGFRLFPPIIINAYDSLYFVPKSHLAFNSNLAFKASIIAVLCIAFSTVSATLQELREVPASLMRPKSPRPGKTILLEKVTFIWKRLKFSKKITARNIFRYKTRFFMTVIGIAACTGLIITGFGLKGGMSGALEEQFGKIYKYNMQVTLKSGIDNNEKNTIRDKAMKSYNIKSLLFFFVQDGNVKNQKSGSEDTYLIVPENKTDVNKYVGLKMNGKPLTLSDDGAIVTEKLAKLMDKKKGDSFEVTVNGKVLKIKIAGITEQYIQHFIYMSPKYYKAVTGEIGGPNAFYGILKSTSEKSENETIMALTKIKGISAVNFNNHAKTSYNKNLESMNAVVLVLIVSAAVLAFIVIYNLTNININERVRELATIKLLGFYNHELAGYIYIENIILTLIGSVFGIGAGIEIERFVRNAAEIDSMMFLKTIKPIYFIYSVALTICFSIIVNLFMYRKFGRIDMIESLKSAE